MTDPSSRDLRYRLLAGMFLVVFLVCISLALLLWRYTPALLAGIVLLSLTTVVCLIRNFVRRRRSGSKPYRVGVLSRDELRVARSRLKQMKRSRRDGRR